MNLDSLRSLRGKVLVIDIETTGLLDIVKDKSDLHILSVGWKGKEGKWKIASTDKEEDIKKIFEDENNIIVGHNFIGYDIRVLRKIFPEIDFKAPIIDTLPLSQYLYNDRVKHGLESWGEDIGFEKVEVGSDEWENLSKEKAIERCERDVLINALLWDKFYNLLMDLYDNDENQLLTPINRANFKQHLLVIQGENKIFLDVEQCQKNIEYLEGIISEKENVLKSVMPKIPIKTKKSKPKNMFRKDGGLSKAGEEWNFIIQSIGLPLEYEGEVEIIKGYKEPNPQSSTQMKDWLFSLGWKPKIFKEGANGKVPQLRDDNKNLCKTVMKLVESVPELEALQGLSVAQHRLGYLKAFMDTKDENNYITASWSGMAKTWRVKHKKPIVNLPSNNSEHGELVRKCLIAPKGKVFCNADLSSLEDLTKQSEIYPYDPEYVATLNDPNYDAHLNIGLLGGFMTQSQVDFYKWYDKTHGKDEEGNIIECPVKEFSNMSDEWAEEFKKLSKIRKGCKVTNYSATYGASANKIAEGADIPLKEAKKLHQAYWDLNWSIKKFAEDRKRKMVDGREWVYSDFSKIWYLLSSPHLVFSVVNQSNGACVFDTMLYFIIKEGIMPIKTVHDELSFYINEGEEEKVRGIIKRVMDKVNKVMKKPVTFRSTPEFAKSYGDVH